MKITELPGGCISHIISCTSPKDACRSSLVCSRFRSATDSDLVWRKFLPHDYHQILSNSALASSSMDSLSKKKLFLHLSDNPIIIDSDKNTSFKIDKESGKKCFMIGARTLSIAWGDTLAHWRWISLPAESRFSRVAELRHIWSLDIKGRIKTNLLSPKSTYGAYFVYKLKEPNWAIKDIQVEFRVYFEGEEEVNEHVSGCKVFLDPSEDEQEPCKVREDGWLEVEMGEFFNDGSEDNRVVVCSLMGTDNYISKGGLVVEGIEFRPKLGS
ncbi:F-box protein PP2-B10 isoform X2 [Ziziphus jujuba]|uniref:F-box protein PP2-B10 isoform X2 n=1 Tax=Ziziphus jujuba TaxID=326968 RepID=A0ABM4A4Z7_ZIZJJ|nr:F-box protein PP2-B10 isoform X2 [Ziziphus jujuba]